MKHSASLSALAVCALAVGCCQPVVRREAPQPAALRAAMARPAPAATPRPGAPEWIPDYLAEGTPGSSYSMIGAPPARLVAATPATRTVPPITVNRAAPARPAAPGRFSGYTGVARTRGMAAGEAGPSAVLLQPRLGPTGETAYKTRPVSAASAAAPPAGGTAPAVIRIPSRTPPAPAGARAPDYRWIIGRLEHDAKADRWSVRFAEAGSNDPDGGALELVGVRSAPGLVAGEMVRVEGRRVAAEAPGAPAAYHLTAMLPAGGPMK